MDIQPKKDRFWAYQPVEQKKKTPEEVVENIKKIDPDRWTFDDMIAAGVPLDPNLIKRPPDSIDKLKSTIRSMENNKDEVEGYFYDFKYYEKKIKR